MLTAVPSCQPELHRSPQAAGSCNVPIMTSLRRLWVRGRIWLLCKRRRWRHICHVSCRVRHWLLYWATCRQRSLLRRCWCMLCSWPQARWHVRGSGLLCSCSRCCHQLPFKPCDAQQHGRCLSCWLQDHGPWRAATTLELARVQLLTMSQPLGSPVAAAEGPEGACCCADWLLVGAAWSAAC